MGWKVDLKIMDLEPRGEVFTPTHHRCHKVDSMKKYNVILKPKKQALHSVGCHKHLFHSRGREYRPAITFLLEPSLVPTAVNVSAWYSFTTWAFVENEYCGRLMENSSQFHSSILSCIKLSQIK